MGDSGKRKICLEEVNQSLNEIEEMLDEICDNLESGKSIKRTSKVMDVVGKTRKILDLGTWDFNAFERLWEMYKRASEVLEEIEEQERKLISEEQKKRIKSVIQMIGNKRETIIETEVDWDKLIAQEEEKERKFIQEREKLKEKIKGIQKTKNKYKSSMATYTMYSWLKSGIDLLYGGNFERYIAQQARVMKGIEYRNWANEEIPKYIEEMIEEIEGYCKEILRELENLEEKGIKFPNINYENIRNYAEIGIGPEVLAEESGLDKKSLLTRGEEIIKWFEEIFMPEITRIKEEVIKSTEYNDTGEEFENNVNGIVVKINEGISKIKQIYKQMEQAEGVTGKSMSWLNELTSRRDYERKHLKYGDRKKEEGKRVIAGIVMRIYGLKKEIPIQFKSKMAKIPFLKFEHDSRHYESELDELLDYEIPIRFYEDVKKRKKNARKKVANRIKDDKKVPEVVRRIMNGIGEEEFHSFFTGDMLATLTEDEKSVRQKCTEVIKRKTILKLAQRREEEQEGRYENTQLQVISDEMKRDLVYQYHMEGRNPKNIVSRGIAWIKSRSKKGVEDWELAFKLRERINAETAKNKGDTITRAFRDEVTNTVATKRENEEQNYRLTDDEEQEIYIELMGEDVEGEREEK